MQRTIRLIALCAAIGCGGENGAGTDFAQHHRGRAEVAPSTFVPNPLCTNNPISSTWDPVVGLPSSAALSQLSPSGTTLRIGIATTNQHYATLKNGVPVGSAIDISCRLGVKLNLPIEFTIYATLPDLLTAFRANKFEIGWAFDPLLADKDLALTNPFVTVPNTYAVGINSSFFHVADVDVPRTPPVKVGAGVGNSPAVYLASHLKYATLVTFTGLAGQAALLSDPKTDPNHIDALASGRASIITFVAANSTKLRALPDNIFYANLAPFMHLSNPDGVCYLNDYLEAAKTSGLVLQALSRITPSVLAAGSAVAPAMPTCAPNARCHDVTVSADGTCHAAASIDSGSDDADSDLAVCAQSPAGPYALGATPVTLTCTDAAGKSASCTATVSVVDTTPPLVATKDITVPASRCGDDDEGRCVPDDMFKLSDCASATDACAGPLDVDAVGTITRVEWVPLQGCDDDGEGRNPLKRAQRRFARHGCQRFAITGNSTANLPIDGLAEQGGSYYVVYFTISDPSGNRTATSCKVQPVKPQGCEDDSDRSDCRGSPTALGCAVCAGNGCGTCPLPSAACERRRDDEVLACRERGE